MHESTDIQSKRLGMLNKKKNNVVSNTKCCIIALQNFHIKVSLFTVGHIDNIGSQLYFSRYHSIPNHTMAHENGMDNRIITLTFRYSNSNHHYHTMIVSHLPLSCLQCSYQLLSQQGIPLCSHDLCWLQHAGEFADRRKYLQ